MRDKIEDNARRARGYMGRMITRRSMIAGACTFSAGMATDTVTDLVKDTLLEAVVTERPAAVTPPVSTRVVDVDRAVRDEGNAEMRAALAHYRDGRPLSDWILRRTTTTYMREGRRWQGAQGHGIRIWPGYGACDIPMEEQPDPLLAANAVWRLDRCVREREPQFWRCAAWVRDTRSPDWPAWMIQWNALTLPGVDGAAVSVTVKV